MNGYYISYDLAEMGMISPDSFDSFGGFDNELPRVVA